MAYTTVPITQQFGNTIEWGYNLTGQGTPSSVSLIPENPTNSSLLLTKFTLQSTGAGTWDFLPSAMADITGVSYNMAIGDPAENELFTYIYPPATASSQYGFGCTLDTEILLRPSFGLVFHVNSIIDSSGSNTMVVRFKFRGSLVDPATTTPFT